MTDNAPLDRQTPCIGVCSTAIGDDVCRGCARTFVEISHWYALPDVEQQRIWRCLPRRHVWLAIAQQVGGHLVIGRDGEAEFALLQREAAANLRMGWPRHDGLKRVVDMVLEDNEITLCISDPEWLAHLQHWLAGR